MSYGLLFSGQGTQQPGMLPWLDAHPASQPLLRALDAALGQPWRAALADATLRSRNATAQPLIVGTALAAWAALQAQLDTAPQAVAGYSVGELAAYACAGVFDARTALALAVQRAAQMDAAVAGRDTGLLSVSGLSAATVLQAHPALDCAIAIGAEQGIYAGEVAVLDACAPHLTAQGALCRRLEVRVASHSRWMASAANAFAAHVADMPFARPQAALVLNASAASSRDPHTLRQALAHQIDHTVQWAASMDTLAEQGLDCVLEIGAGSTLAKMWNQRHPHIPARALDEFRDATGAARGVARQGGVG